MSITSLLEREISGRFKEVDYVRIEEDIRIDPQFVGEYSRIGYAPITGREDSFYHQKRRTLSVIIRFTDNTGFKTHLKPEDYLGIMREETVKIPAILGTDMFQRSERKYDLDKILSTLLRQLNGEKFENPTLELVDYMNEIKTESNDGMVLSFQKHKEWPGKLWYFRVWMRIKLFFIPPRFSSKAIEPAQNIIDQRMRDIIFNAHIRPNFAMYNTDASDDDRNGNMVSDKIEEIKYYDAKLQQWEAFDSEGHLLFRNINGHDVTAGALMDQVHHVIWKKYMTREQYDKFWGKRK